MTSRMLVSSWLYRSAQSCARVRYWHRWDSRLPQSFGYRHNFMDIVSTSRVELLILLYARLTVTIFSRKPFCLGCLTTSQSMICCSPVRCAPGTTNFEAQSRVGFINRRQRHAKKVRTDGVNTLRSGSSTTGPRPTLSRKQPWVIFGAMGLASPGWLLRFVGCGE
jgi:hypothetical protein